MQAAGKVGDAEVNGEESCISQIKLIARHVGPSGVPGTIKRQPEGVNCIRFTQLTHSHRVTTPLTSVKV